MSELISRSAALKAVNAYDYKGMSLSDVRTVTDGCAEKIRRLPYVDAEPVRHGRYDKGGDCTVCGYPMPTDDRCGAIFPQGIKYCYNCGAKLDLEVQ